jgi:hypothetical protein
LGPIETLKIGAIAFDNGAAKVVFYEGQAAGGKFHGWGRSLWYCPGMQPGTYRPVGEMGENRGKEIQRKTSERIRTKNKELENNPFFYTSKSYSGTTDFIKPASP